MKLTRFFCLVFVVALAPAWSGWSRAAETVSEPSVRDLQPLAESAWDLAKARHLLTRAGFGGTPEEARRLHAMGLRGAVDFLVDFDRQSWPGVAIDLGPPELPDRSRFDTAAFRKLGKAERAAKVQRLKRDFGAAQRKRDRRQLFELRSWWMQRMIESPRPLEEKLTLFWHGHFASGHKTVKSAYAMYVQNELFRDQAAGNFGELLKGIIHDPAMLRYLDNDKNLKSHPNENLAREILELFSMGEGNYTEEDVKQAARALTGYGFDRRTLKPVFRARVHDQGEKTIFGERGNWDGDEFIGLILKQPETAHFIARKIFVFFVNEAPDDQTVDLLARTFRENGYELRPLLKTLFLSNEFYSSNSMGTQIKSPVQLVVGLHKSLNTTDVDHGVLVNACRVMGQELFEPPNVKGWDGGRSWINTNSLFLRNNSAAILISGRGPRGPARGKGREKGNNRKPNNNRKPGDNRKPGNNRKPGKGTVGGRGLDLVGLLDSAELDSSAEVVSYLATACLTAPLSQSKQRKLVDALEATGALPPASEWKAQRVRVNTKLRAVLILIASLPEFQLT